MAAEVVLEEVKVFGLVAQEDEDAAVAEKRELKAGGGTRVDHIIVMTVQVGDRQGRLHLKTEVLFSY